MINNNIKVYIVLLLIFYIILTICIYRFFCCNNKKKENFIGFLEMVSSITETNIKKDDDDFDEDIKNNNKIVKNDEVNLDTTNKKIKKYIYISKINYNSSIIKYNFYNKDNEVYLNTTINNDNNTNNTNTILIKDISNNIIGKDINKRHNKITLNFNMYKSNIIIEYYNKFNSIKIYLENDDKFFHINKKNNNYTINLYTLNIGSIIYDEYNNIYKIIVLEDYKTYLNLFGIGIIMLLHY
jgi:hypothetical protein